MTHTDSHHERPDSGKARLVVEQAIRRIVPDAEFADLDPHAPLRAEFELDSLDFLSFVELLSSGTGVRIDEADYGRLDTLATCVDFLSGNPGHH
jgi:hypothetical protein